MGLLAFLRGERRGPSPDQALTEIVRQQGAQLAEIRSEVQQLISASVEPLREDFRKLADRQVEREMAFTETRDAVLRHLKRLDELTRRREQLEQSAGQDEPLRATAELLRMKFPKQGG
ncbi:MAG: hypothetical protein ACRDLY_15910 [Thermoleophilaceae bacterium]